MLPHPAPSRRRTPPRPTPARRAVRRVALVAATLLALSSVAACGSADGGDAVAPGLGSVTISGDVGTVPSVSFADQIAAGSQDTETVVTGDGAALGDDDSVVVNYWVGNGFTQQAVKDSFGPKTAGALAVVGQDPAAPQTVDQLLGNAAAALVTDGMTMGSRVASVGTADEVLGVQDLPELKIGNLDPVVLVVDVVQQPLSEPDGDPVDPVPNWVPGLPFVDGRPSLFTFGRLGEPSDTLRSFTRIVGKGDEVEKGDVIVANYLGQVFDAKKPFDESYSGEPVAFPIGLGNVIKGWDQALVGQTVGSRVLLAIPAKLGYGTKGSPQAGIEGGDTLYFVVDILAAA